jgi:putative spermidine/putrescine transport system ATP-binding protein
MDATATADIPARAAAARPGASLRLDGIAKSYGPHRAVANLDLEIAAGEFITFLGPSGSGKTTALMLIAGFERPTAGEIFIDARPVAALPPYRRNIGVVFQSYALFPHLTVAENIGFALKQRGVSRAERQEQVARMLDLVQLNGYEGRYPQQLSGGQQQRVAIARAIVFNPRVLLMDEPLSALDKQLRENLQLEIKRLHARLGITFVYVTHDQREALVMSDRVAVMNEGRLEQIAPPEQLYGAPTNRFVAAFVGEANFFVVRDVAPSPGGLRLLTENGPLDAPMQPHVPAALCMVRPEWMAVAPSGTAVPGRNTVDASVRETVFMGEMVRYVLQSTTGASLTVKQPYRPGDTPLSPGDAAVVSWAIADTRLVA